MLDARYWMLDTGCWIKDSSWVSPNAHGEIEYLLQRATKELPVKIYGIQHRELPPPQTAIEPCRFEAELR